MRTHVFLPASALVLIASANAFGGELRVDINRGTKNQANYTQTGYTNWYNGVFTDVPATGTGADAQVFTSALGESVTVALSQTPASAGRGGLGLRTGLYQTGGDIGAKLVSDGITVDTKDLPSTTLSNIMGEIQMTITGLEPGSHTLLTYHNHWDALAAGTLGPIDIYLNGVLQVNNLQPAIRQTNTALVPSAYLEFTVAALSDVTTILFVAESNPPPSVTIRNPVVNGFEIDTPNAFKTANSPSPADGDEHVNADTGSALLSWSPALSGTTVSHDVYFGTNQTAVKNATHASPQFMGNQAGPSYPVSSLNSMVTYYWRIDEVNGAGTATKGTVWMFRPRHLAFPGAEGYGRFARGGRGGVVVEVTNTNDTGPGSLRDALTGNYGPRTVVFNVSGLITLESDLIINSANPYLTLAGQTAPGKGICVNKHQLGMSGGRDVIIRHVRSRPGNLSGLTMNGSGMAGSDHCIMDHVSISWGLDEELSTRTAKNVTFQRSLISEALNISGHQNYPAGTRHGYAASVGGNVASLHHNLLAHNDGRNWSMAGGLDAAGYYAGRLDIFNNVVYNWGHRTTDGGAHEVNFVNNYYQPGPASTYFFALNAQYGGFPGTQRYYFEGNVMPGRFTVGNQSAGKTLSTENGGTLPQNSTPPYSAWANTPFFLSHAVIDEVTNAYKKVLSDVGCNLPLLDDHDARVIRETIGGTCTYTGSVSLLPGLPDSQDDVGGWEDYGKAVRPPHWDTDHDGLPNWWEEIKGLNPNSTPNDFSDSNGDPDGDEYTNLEDYLNWMAEPHLDCSSGSFVDIDLRQFARGYTNNAPVFSAFAPANGAVSVLSGHIARFTPSVSSNALGSFAFSVTDAQGYLMTRNIGLRLISIIAPPVLGIRNESGALFLEVTGSSGGAVSVEAGMTSAGPWLEWTNLTATGTLQLLPLNGVSAQETLFFRAASQ